MSRSPVVQHPASNVEVAIVGAGAAGIAAARHCVAAGLTVRVLEARNRVGGRAVTASFGGHPIDLGAHWLHAGSVNPLVRLGLARGEPLRRAPRDGQLVVDGRFASRTERTEHGTAFDRADRAFAAAARTGRDPSLAAAFPPLGRWGASIAATMALVSGRPLAEVSSADFPSEEFGDNYFIAGGYGAYLARLAKGLPIRLGAPVSSVDWSGRSVRLLTATGEVTGARAVIVTVPLPVLQSGTLAFTPGLPSLPAEAVASFLPGTYEHVILNWPDTPFRRPDRLTKITGRRGSYGMLTAIDGAPFHYLELDHETVARFDGRGADALARFARRFLRDAIGSRAGLSSGRTLHVTDWRHDRWAACSWAVVPPGAAGIRTDIRSPVPGRIWFAGEATSRTMWGTVGGAWAEGERAAQEAVDSLTSRP